MSGRLSDLASILPGYAPAPPATDRAFWDGLPQATRAALIADAEKVASSDWATLPARHYRAFAATGDRAAYEIGYFTRRGRLTVLALGEAAENKGRFIDALIDGLMLIVEESGWQLPAHNSQVRDGKFDPLPDPAHPVIDLFAAETGALLSLVVYLLRGALDAATPMVVERIKREISTRITRPYLGRNFWWMSAEGETTNNWTVWCTQNILISTFVRPTSQATRRAVITKAATSLDAFMRDYGEDGACDEGPAYYRHAALCLFGALNIMDEVAPSVFAQVWQQPKLRNIAEYILNTNVADSWHINFADAAASIGPCGAREFLFGKKVGSDALCALAAADARTVTEAPAIDTPEGASLFNRLLDIVAASEIDGYDKEPVTPPDIYYPSTGLFVARDGHFTLAAKAGDNDDSHNHNDVGSVTLYAGGKPLLIDVGVETYTKKTFSPERYDIWTMQSAFHNLPSFEGIGQMAGADFAARDVAVSLGDDVSEVTMEIAGAYPAEAGVSSYRRRVRLIKGTRVEIVDTYHGSRPPELSLMFADRPTVSDGQISVEGGETIAVSGAGTMRVEDIAVTDEWLLWTWPECLYRVLVPLAGNEISLVIEKSGETA